MARSFSSVEELRRLPPSPVREALLNDLAAKPAECSGFADLLECADSTVVLVQPDDDIRNLVVNGGPPLDLADFETRCYETVSFIAGGLVLIVAEIGTIFCVPAAVLSPEDRLLFAAEAARTGRAG